VTHNRVARMRRMASEVESSLLSALDVVRSLTYSEIYSRMTESTVPEVGEEVQDRGAEATQSDPQDGDTPPMDSYEDAA